MTLPLKGSCDPCKYCEYDPKSGWTACAKHGGLTPGLQCDDFEDRYATEREKGELKGTIDLEDLKTGKYKPITEDTILTPEQMSLYHMGYVDGMKWVIKQLQEPEIRRPITDKEWDQFFESISQTNRKG